MTSGSLGRELADWRHRIEDAPDPDTKFQLFEGAAQHGATYLARGVAYTDIVDRLADLALICDINGERVETIIGGALASAPEPELVPDPIDDDQGPEFPAYERAIREGLARRAKTNGAHPPTRPSRLYAAGGLRLKEFAPLRKICGDIIVEGLTLLAARPKIGKTWLALDIACAVDQGGLCLGDIKCERGDVLFLALEDNQRRMQRRLTKLLGVHKTEWPNFEVAHEWPRADAGGVEAIRDWITAHPKARMVVVDVLARFRKLVAPGKQSYDADYEVIAALQKVASETGVAIVVIHHTRKGEADDPIDAVSGTLGLAGAADAILVITRKADGVQLYGRSRDVDEIDKALEFNRETCRWSILGESADVHFSHERRELLDAMTDEPMALKDIAARVGKSVKAVFRLLDRMAQEGQAIKSGRGLYSRPKAPGGNGGSPWWTE